MLTSDKPKLAGVNPEGHGFIGPAPERDASGTLHFSDKQDFRPNLTPLEILKAGAFGGGAFRDMYSSLNNTTYTNVWKELPQEWLDQLDVNTLTQSTYNADLNKYRAKPEKGTPRSDVWGVEYWSSQGWIQPQDPYGWFMWYYRFYLGRRSDDDDRQIKKWVEQAGEMGRFRLNLIALCLVERKAYDDISVSPILRQQLFHYAYELTFDDFVGGSKHALKGDTYIPKLFLPTEDEFDEVYARCSCGNHD